MPKRKINCVECGEKLAGRKIRFCSDRCRKRYTRRGEKAESVVDGCLPAAPVSVSVVSVAKAAASDDVVVTLRALRNKLAVEVDLSEHPRDIAVWRRVLWIRWISWSCGVVSLRSWVEVL